MTLLPNFLTIIRLIMVPVFIRVYFAYPDKPMIPFIVFALAMLTDALDGFLARALRCTSRFGALADPLADKLMTLSAVFCLTWSKVIPLPALMLVAFRELVMMTGAFFAARTGIIIKAGVPGKISTILFTASLIMLLPWHGVEQLTQIGGYLIYVAIGVSLYAAAYYAAILMKRMSKVKTQ